MTQAKTEKICKGLHGNPCIVSKKPQPIKNYSGRSAVCRQCQNKKKREDAERKRKINQTIDRRQETPKFLEFVDLVATRLWTDPALKNFHFQKEKSPQ